MSSAVTFPPTPQFVSTNGSPIPPLSSEYNQAKMAHLVKVACMAAGAAIYAGRAAHARSRSVNPVYQEIDSLEKRSALAAQKVLGLFNGSGDSSQILVDMGRYAREAYSAGSEAVAAMETVFKGIDEKVKNRDANRLAAIGYLQTAWLSKPIKDKDLQSMIKEIETEQKQSSMIVS